MVDILGPGDCACERIEGIQHFGDAEEHTAFGEGFFDTAEDDSTFCRTSSFNGCFVYFNYAWSEISGGEGRCLKK